MFDKQTSFPRAASRVDIVSRLASAGARVRSRCAAGHARLPCDDPSAARYFERRCVCLILAVGVHLRYRTSQSTLQPGVFRRHAHSENSNSHTHEMYYQRFVGLSAQLREKQGLQTSINVELGSTLTFFLSSLVARARPRAQVHNAAATGRAGFNPRAWRGVRAVVSRREPRGSARRGASSSGQKHSQGLLLVASAHSSSRARRL